MQMVCIRTVCAYRNIIYVTCVWSVYIHLVGVCVRASPAQAYQ